MEAVKILWLVLLTIGQLFIGAIIYTTRADIRTRNNQLDIREHLHTVTQMIQSRDIHKDRELRQAVERLLAVLEADPVSRGRHIVDITTLKERLK